MQVECPNCHKPIDLVGPKELKEDFGIGPNSVQHARDKGKFPAPWLSFPNRNIWVRQMIEAYVEERSRARLESTVAELTKALEGLPAVERRQAKRMLEKKLAG